VLIPWFIYGVQTYSNPLGPFLHGFEASSYWGGSQPWYFFFQYSWQMLSIILLLFLVSLGYITYKKDFKRKEIYFLLIGIVFLFVMALLMPHKEDRYILSIIPAICILCGFFVSKIGKYRNLVILFVAAILLLSLSINFGSEYLSSHNEYNSCFLKANEFAKNIPGNILIMTDDSPIVYYYTGKETHFSPSSLTMNSTESLAKLYSREIYLLSSLNFSYGKAFDCPGELILYKVR
jgi:hypothetical protein